MCADFSEFRAGQNGKIKKLLEKFEAEKGTFEGTAQLTLAMAREVQAPQVCCNPFLPPYVLSVPK